MIPAYVLVAVALVVLLLLLYLEGGHLSSVRHIEDLAGQTRPVDIEAFRNLLDPKEDDFLRMNLRPSDFRVAQRERARSAVDYIRNTSHNAACLTRLGEAAAKSPDPRVAKAGRELVDTALRLRTLAILATLQLYLRMATPAAQFSYGKLADNYQHLSSLAGQVALLQDPTEASKLSALL